MMEEICKLCIVFETKCTNKIRNPVDCRNRPDSFMRDIAERYLLIKLSSQT